MAILGAKNEIVNAQAVQVRFGATPDDYILAIRKDMDWNSPQRRIATGAGSIYFTMLPDNKMHLTFPYTSGEVNAGVPANFDEMIKRNATSKEVPENLWHLKFFDRQTPTPTSNSWDMNAKVTRLHAFALGEGETIVEIDLQIIDDEPSIVTA